VNYEKLGLMTLLLNVWTCSSAYLYPMQFLDVKETFCHGSASVITFYVISTVLLHQLSSDYRHYITFLVKS